MNHSKVKLVRHDYNKGVGGAMKTGMKEAKKERIDIIAKMDGDNQMDPQYLPGLLYPLIRDECDFTKGNRFSILEFNKSMPLIRKIGNQILTFFTKISSGYWHIFDPQNGFLAVKVNMIRKLNLDWISDDYFFENSMLINLNIIEARVSDVYIPARYGEEESSLNIMGVILKFPFYLIKGFLFRIFYRYAYIDFSPIAVLFYGGTTLFGGGILWGLWSWYRSVYLGLIVPIGTFALGLIPILIGFQMILNGFILDIQNSPKGFRKRYDFSQEDLEKIVKDEKTKNNQQ